MYIFNRPDSLKYILISLWETFFSNDYYNTWWLNLFYDGLKLLKYYISVIIYPNFVYLYIQTQHATVTRPLHMLDSWKWFFVTTRSLAIKYIKWFSICSRLALKISSHLREKILRPPGNRIGDLSHQNIRSDPLGHDWPLKY